MKDLGFRALGRGIALEGESEGGSGRERVTCESEGEREGVRNREELMF